MPNDFAGAFEISLNGLITRQRINNKFTQFQRIKNNETVIATLMFKWVDLIITKYKIVNHKE